METKRGTSGWMRALYGHDKPHCLRDQGPDAPLQFGQEGLHWIHPQRSGRIRRPHPQGHSTAEEQTSPGKNRKAPSVFLHLLKC